MITTTETDLESARSQRLKAATQAIHAALDKRIMGEDIFASRERFAGFVRAQYRFHRDVDVLYASPALGALLPGLSERRRLPEIANDLSDLRQPLPAPAPGRLRADTPLAEALGWLYVAEGSNLGATVLYKLAAGLGLNASHGARHLVAHPQGAARHWRAFTAVLDAVPLSPEQEAVAIVAAEEAFRTVRGYVEEEFGMDRMKRVRPA
ncbi:MAG: biliverdin-producing heme oxygenase [Luteimonas sp.]